MNAAFLIMSTAALAGADPVPPPPPPAAPVVVSGAGCSNCGAPASTGCCGSSRVGIFDRIKGRVGGWGFGKKSSDCCAPAPSPAPTCCGSIADRPNLFDTLKSRWGSKKNASVCCDPCASGAIISAPPATPPSGTGTTPPKEMPKPKDEKPKDKGGNSSSAPVPLPPVPTVNGASGSNPY